MRGQRAVRLRTGRERRDHNRCLLPREPQKVAIPHSWEGKQRVGSPREERVNRMAEETMGLTQHCSPGLGEPGDLSRSEASPLNRGRG